ncbi:MAG: EscU/YscU/HrcU family type III secretion system export apparatus switch protein [Deltaproteobacteria bacterium]|nr:EscU/YscU/HrcU family type III secretion system export apparatus switch protein [Deltaproteobacteria bacterium]
MADESSSQEKTEDATPKRLREAHKKGQVPRSKDLNTVVILVLAFALLSFMMTFFYEEFHKLILGSIDLISQKSISPEQTIQFLHTAFFTLVKTLLPYVLIIGVVAAAAGFFQTGPVFSTEPLKPQAKRLNMVENIKNMFKVTTFVELLKNIAKVTLVLYMAYVVIKQNLAQILMTTTTDLTVSTHIAGEVLSSFLMRVFALFVIIAIIDVMVQRWQFKKQLRMSKEEVKREYKQDEGDPLIKSIRKQLHQELAMGDVKKQVAASDVVVTNPTHLAIAIKYDEKEMMAPQIMAKGQRLFAEKIREIAETENIPIIQNVPLAWSLIELEIGAEIPEELYQAIAEVLIVIYRMRDQKEKQLNA